MSKHLVKRFIDATRQLLGLPPRRASRPSSRTRAHIGIEELESRVVPSGAPPIAAGDFYGVPRNVPITFSGTGSVLANDFDFENDTLTAVQFSGPSHGSLTLNSNGSFTYTSASGYAGPDSFSYRAYDGTGYSSPATVTITVFNSAPTASSDSFGVLANRTTNIDPGVLYNDSDPNGDPLTAVQYSSTSHGSLTLNSDGTFDYTPTTGYAGSDSFNYQAYDGVAYSGITPVYLTVLHTLDVDAEPVSATAGTSTGSILVATVTPTDAGLDAEDLSAVIHWGDGTTTSIPASPTNGIVDNLDGTFGIMASHTYVAYGETVVRVAVTDTVNHPTVEDSDDAAIAKPVVLADPGPQSDDEGDTVSLYLSGTGSGTLTYGADGLPPGLVIDPTTGEITGAVAAGAAAGGPYSVHASVTNGTYSDSLDFTWTVGNTIALTNPGPQSDDEGDPVSLAITSSYSGGGTLSFGAVGLPYGLSIDPDTGDITGTVAVGAAAGGPYEVTVTAGDGATSSSVTFTWAVGSPLALAAPDTQESTEGDAASLTVGATYSGGGTLAYTATGLPAGLSINTATGAITGTVAAGAAAFGPYTVTVSVGDGTYSASASFQWDVSSPITITAPDDQDNDEGDSVSLQIDATDATSGTLAYGAVGLPGGLSIDSATGEITGTIDVGAAADGPYYVVVLVANGSYGASASFSWAVASPVTITNPGAQTGADGDAVSLAVAGAGSGSLTYSAAGLPTGLSINSSTGAITGTLAASGDFVTTVTVSNGTYGASAAFSWTVTGDVTVTDPGDQAYNAGDGVSLAVQASGGGSLTYAASGLPTGLSINSSTGVIAGTIGSGVAPGVYTTTLTVTDGVATGTQSFDWTIYPTSLVVVTNPGTQADDEGDGVSLSISASYSGAGTLVYAAYGLPAGLSIDPDTGDITGTVSAGASAFGPYTTMVVVTDGTESDSQSFTWNVGSPITLSNPGTQADAEGDVVSLALTATYAGPGTLSYAALGLPAGLVIDPATGDITGTIDTGASAFGPYTVTVQAAADDFAAAQTFTWTVTSPITLTNPGDQGDDEGDPVSLPITASGSGTLSYAAAGLPAGLSIDPSTGDITGTLPAGAGAFGPALVTVVVSNGSYSASASFTWEVTAPIAITAIDDQSGEEGDAVSLTISATDATSGTMRYGALGLPAGLAINPTTGAITGTLAAGSAGSYLVRVAVGNGSYSSSVEFYWDVSSPVAIANPGSQSGAEGDTVSLQIDVDYSGGGSLDYAAEGLPDGLAIDPDTGEITGTLGAGGSWSATVTVSDGTYGASVSFFWYVGSDVSITYPGAQSGAEGDTVSLQIEAETSGVGSLTYSAAGLPDGLSIDSGTGEISGTIDGDTASDDPYEVTITVTDGSSTAVESFSWYVRTDSPVQLANPGDLTSTAGDQITFFVYASDSAGGTLMYSADGLPEGLHINPFTGFLFGTIDLGANSGTPYEVTVRASDGTSSAAKTFSWTVNAEGPLTLANPGDQWNDEGNSVSVTVTKTYTGGGTVRYVAYDLPAGLAINTATGAITGTIAVGAARGRQVVTVAAFDGTNSDSRSFVWTVSGPIAVTRPADQGGEEGDSVSLQIDATDATSGTLSYAADGLPAGLAIDPDTGLITGTIGVGAAGSYFVTVMVGNGTSSSSQYFAWEVSNPVTVTEPDTQSFGEGDIVALQIDASTTGVGTLTYAAFNLPAGLSIDPSTGIISGTVATGASGIGSYDSFVVVTDGAATSGTHVYWEITGEVAVESPGYQAGVVGDVVSLQVQAAYTGGGTLSYAARGLPVGLSIDTTTGLITGTIDAGAADIGWFVTTVTATDGTASNSVAFGWSVVAAGAITLQSPGAQSNAEGDVVNLSLSGSYSGGGTLSYFAEGLPAGLSIDPDTGDITGTIALYTASNTAYTATIVASDGIESVSKTFEWAISGALSVDPIGDQSDEEGHSVSVQIYTNYTGAGTLVYSAVGLPAGLVIDSDTGEIRGTLAVGTAGIYFVGVTASDGNSSETQSYVWEVEPSIEFMAITDQENVEGDSVSLTPSVNYSGSGTLSYSSSWLPYGLSINPTTGVIAGTIAAGSADLDVKPIVVTVTDGTSSSTIGVNWSVRNPISIVEPATQFAIAGAGIRPLPIQTIYSGGGSLSYKAIDAPTGVSINSSTGEFTGTIGSQDAGYHLTTVEVTDTFSTTRISFQWWVGAPGLGLTTYVQSQVLQPQPKSNPVISVLEKTFGVWTKNGLTRAEMQKLIARGGEEELKGENAAALAALYLISERLENVYGVNSKVGITIADIKNAEALRLKQPPDLTIQAPNADELKRRYISELQFEYDAALAKLQRPREVLRGSKKDETKWIISPATILGKDRTITQGKLNDCVLLASLISMLNVEVDSNQTGLPEIRIDAAITTTRIDAYNVKLPGVAKALTVAPPTECQIALYSEANGIWSILIEAAIARELKDDAWFRPRELLNPVPNDFDRLTMTQTGKFSKEIGGMKQTLWRLEGHEKDFTDGTLPSQVNLLVELLKNPEASEARLKQELEKVANKKPGVDGFSTMNAIVVASTPKATALFPLHAYAVIGYKSKKGEEMIRLVNPHNNPADKNYGKQFDLSLKEFMKQFVMISIGESIKLPKK